MNQILGSTAREEIRNAMSGLSGTAAKREAARLAANHGISWQHVYGMTRDVRAGERKQRSDAGKRTFVLEPGTDLYYAMQLVVVDKLDPDQALLTARMRGKQNLPTLETFCRYLREHGLGKGQRRKARRAHRRWEAEFPGQIYQIDCTALKTRWLDETSRRAMKIEGIDKNHPQMDPTKLRVWQIMLVDDYSRRRFLRYVATPAITSLDIVRFECEAFNLLGVPRQLYTDNGSEFKGYHVRAERILNSLLADEGGYQHVRHAPNNPQATGKVEASHKWSEKADRFIGLAVSEGQKITIDDLNRFADEICEHYNHRVHRATGEKPMNRWHGKRVVVRKVSPDVIESALLSDEFEVVIDAALTVTHRKVPYQLPSVYPNGKRAEFVDYIGRKVRVVVPHSIAMILVTLPNAEGKFEPTNGGTFEVDKRVAGVDAAGEFKTMAESTGERLTREMKDARKQEIASIKEQKKLTGEIAPVPHLNVPVEVDKGSVANFPHREHVVAAETVNDLVPVIAQPEKQPETAKRPNVAYVGKPVSYWQAVTEFSSKFDSQDAAKTFLRTLFTDDNMTLPETEVAAAIDGRTNGRKLRLAS